MIAFLLLLLKLVTDGDLLILTRRMIDLRGRNTVRVTKVKGHADECMVFDGRVRELDWLGNDAADEAADFGRRRVGPPVIDACRNLSGVCGRLYPVLLDLHRFFLLLSLELLLIMMGLEAPLLIRWSGLLVLCPRGGGLLMLFVTLLCFLDLLLSGLVSGLLVLRLPLMLMMWLSGPTLMVFWLNGWPFLVHCIGLLVVWILVLVVCGISHVELLILHELWAGERLTLEKSLSSFSSAWASNFSVGCSVWSRH